MESQWPGQEWGYVESCVAHFTNTTMLVLGGRNLWYGGSGGTEAYRHLGSLVHDILGSGFTWIAHLQTQRYRHGCVKAKVQGEDVVMTTGGVGFVTPYLKSTEIFKIANVSGGNLFF